MNITTGDLFLIIGHQQAELWSLRSQLLKVQQELAQRDQLKLKQDEKNGSDKVMAGRKDRAESR
jgi:hypothetical protein